MALNDQFVLQTDPTFIQRVRASMIAAAVAIANEAITAGAGGAWLHKARANYAAQILNNPEAFKLLFTAAAATDPTVQSDATQGSTVALTAGNVAAQAALVTDAHINNAVSGQWNAFLQLP